MDSLLPESIVALLWQIPFALLVAYLYYRIDHSWRQFHDEQMEKWRQFHKEESEQWQRLICDRDAREERIFRDTAEIVKANTVALNVNGVVEDLKEEIRKQQNGG